MLRFVGLAAAMAIVGGACSSDPAATSVPKTTGVPATVAAPSDSPTDSLAATSPGVGLPCAPPTFAPLLLPDRVAEDVPAPAVIEVDRWTAQPGTSLSIWTDASGSPVVALVRGALPPERWSAQPQRVSIRGVEAALGPLSDGMWAAAWFEGPDRCDEYTLYLYPPAGREEAMGVAESLAGGSG